jgi:predicted nucleic acid-binding protein
MLLDTNVWLAMTKVWNDAYLAAFAEAAAVEMVTFDQGFKQFNLAHCTILT